MMSGRLPKRKRQVARAIGLSLIAFILLFVIAWFVSPTKEQYVPGESNDALTTGLSRDVPKDYPRVVFTDVTTEAGIDFRHFSDQRSVQLPEDMGSGAAWGDYDRDGWLDLFIANEVGPITFTEEQRKNSPAHCALYHNNGDGTFSDVSAAAGLELRSWAMSAAWADYNRDGYPDLIVSNYGKNNLFLNMGDGTFTDRSDEAGVGGLEGFWAGASWGDYDRDGFPDLYICGYVRYSPRKENTVARQYNVEVPSSINPSSFEPERNLLYRNLGNGSFEEVSKQAGVEDIKGRSLSAAWCDLDEDGWPDLYVANDVSDNVLFRNKADGTFEEISHQALVADYRGAMGIAVGDWDGDLDQDLFITHWIAQENALYNNLRSQLGALTEPSDETRFMDEADRFGLGQIALDFIGFGTSFFDYDNDGKQDLLVVNGSTFQQKKNPNLLVPMRDQLFWNRGAREGFYEVSRVSGNEFKKAQVGRGAAFGDYDNDGDIDVFVVNNGGPGVLLRNDGGNNNHWLKVKLKGVKSNTEGFGARVKLVAGDMVQVSQAGAQCSYCSQNSPIVHFGLGSSRTVDTLEVLWPSGLKQEFQNLTPNQTLEITEGVENSSGGS